MDEAKVLEELYLLTVRPEFKTQRAMVEALKVVRASEELLVDVDGKTALAVAQSLLAPHGHLIDPACLALGRETAVAGGLTVTRQLFLKDYVLLSLQVVSEANGKTKLHISTAVKQNAQNGQSPANGLAAFKQVLLSGLRARDLQKRKPALLQALASASGQFRYTPQGIRAPAPPATRENRAKPEAKPERDPNTPLRRQSSASSGRGRWQADPDSLNFIDELDGNPDRWFSFGVPHRGLINEEKAWYYFTTQLSSISPNARVGAVYKFTFHGVRGRAVFLSGVTLKWSAMTEGTRGTGDSVAVKTIDRGPFQGKLSRHMGASVCIQGRNLEERYLEWDSPTPPTDDLIRAYYKTFEHIKSDWYAPRVKLLFPMSLGIYFRIVEKHSTCPSMVCVWPEFYLGEGGDDRHGPQDIQMQIQCTIYSLLDARFFSPLDLSPASREELETEIRKIGETCEKEFGPLVKLHKPARQSGTSGTEGGRKGFEIEL